MRQVRGGFAAGKVLVIYESVFCATNPGKVLSFFQFGNFILSYKFVTIV